MEVIGHRVVRVTPSRHAVTVEIDQGRQDDPRMTKKSDSVLRTLARLAVELVVLGAGLGSKAANADQLTRVGNQTGGRVFLFLHTDHFERDYERLVREGVRIMRPPSKEPYGTVAVFADLYGNLWDLIEPA